jgi:SAM-dependent methyltransferase
MTRAEHWNAAFGNSCAEDVSWFEAEPTVSLRLMEAAGLTPATCVIDVGGGGSRLVDALIARGLHCVAVLDVSGVALERARGRLASAAAIPTWIEADVTGEWTLAPVDIWHDRAAFHFLTDAADRAAYRSNMLRTLKRGGQAIVATFALDGPEKCSGLPVARYSPETLSRELGRELELVESLSHVHRTPWGIAQSFQYSRFRRP